MNTKHSMLLILLLSGQLALANNAAATNSESWSQYFGRLYTQIKTQFSDFNAKSFDPDQKYISHYLACGGFHIAAYKSTEAMGCVDSSGTMYLVGSFGYGLGMSLNGSVKGLYLRLKQGTSIDGFYTGVEGGVSAFFGSSLSALTRVENFDGLDFKTISFESVKNKISKQGALYMVGLDIGTPGAKALMKSMYIYKPNKSGGAPSEIELKVREYKATLPKSEDTSLVSADITTVSGDATIVSGDATVISGDQTVVKSGDATIIRSDERL